MSEKELVLEQGKKAAKKQNRYILLASTLLPAAIFMLSLCVGRFPLSLRDVLSMLGSLFGGSMEGIADVEKNVFFNIRLPRSIFGFLAGGALGISGCVLQGVFRNPLVSDDVMGVSSGATLGAAISIVLLGGGRLQTQIFAFVFGILTMLMIFRLSSIRNAQNVLSIILAGVIINSIMKSAISLIKYIADPYSALVSLDYWLMGSLNTIVWADVLMFLPFFLGGIIVLLLLRWQVNLLSLGDEEAAALGVRVRLVRGCLVTASTILVAAVVSMTGIISWVGLISPHVVRLLLGNDHSKAIPLSFIIGAVLMSLSDMLARSIVSVELPLSAIVSVLGAPMLGYLLWKAGNNAW